MSLLQPASAALLMEESFNYTTGSSLAGDGPWTGTGAALSILSGNLSFSVGGDNGVQLKGLSPSGRSVSILGGAEGSAIRGFTDTPITSGDLYFAALIRCTVLPGTGDFSIASLLPGGATAPSGSTDPSSLFIQGTGTGYFVGIKHTGYAADYASRLLRTNTTHLVVMKYVFGGGGNSQLYLDPTPGSPEPSSPSADSASAGPGDGGTPVDPPDLSVLGFAAQADPAQGTWIVDTLRVGTQWADVTPAALTFTTSPRSQAVCAGTPVTFRAAATGNVPLSYQWRAGGVAIDGATTTTYTLANPGPADALVGYDVVVNDALGSITSRLATLTVSTEPPNIITPPTFPVISPGTSNVTFTVVAGGDPPLSYQWRRNGTNISGATRSSYTLVNFQPTDATNSFDIIVSNPCGSVTSTPPAQVALPHEFFALDGAPSFFPGMNIWTTNTPAMTLYSWSSSDASLSIAGWALEGQLSEQPLNDGTGKSRYTITVVPATSPVYYLVGQTTSPPYIQPVPFISIATDAQGNYSLSSSSASVGSDGVLAVTSPPSPPSITVQPQPQTVTAGQNATFRVTAAGTGPLTYQWYFNSSTPMPTGSNATLTLSSVTAANAGNYSVVVSNSAGSVTSSVVALAVLPGGTPPAIAGQPQPQTVMPGQTATFNVTANGTAPLRYQWYFNSTTRLASGTNATLTVPSATATNEGSYSVVVTNPYGSVTSSVAVLALPHQFWPLDGAPSFFAGMNIWTTNSALMTLSAWSSADVSLPITGWTLEGSLSEQPLNDGTGKSRYTITVVPATSPVYYLVGQATAPPYVQPVPFVSIATDAQGNYSLSSSSVSIGSDGVLAVTVPPSPPSIMVQPQPQTVTAGQNATFSVTAAGTAPLSYQWYFNSSTPIATGSGASLTLSSVTAANGGNYSVVVSNSVGSVTSSVAALTVLAGGTPPSITGQPQPQSVTAGQTATFNVTATGSTPLSYQWYFNSNTRLASATSATLSLPGVSAANAGSYSVVVSNAYGSLISSPAVLTVLAPGVPPSITVQPLPQTVTAGQSATFSVTAAGTAPLRYQWYLNSTTALAAATNSALTLTGVTAANAGNYSVVAMNGYGNVTSSVAVLTVLTGGTVPIITTQPADQTALAGWSVRFSVTGTGAAPLSYQWYFNSSAVAGGTDAALTLMNVTSPNAGGYWVVLNNAYGGATSSVAVLKVLVPPVITAQPQSQTVHAGKTATFSVSASSSSALSYQWYFNSSTALPGATGATLTLPAVTAANAGSYSVVVVNSDGAVTSGAAMLSILPPPLLTAQASAGGFQFSGIGVPGGTYLVQSASALSPPVAWVALATNVADASGRVLFTTTNVSADQIRFYRLVAQ